MFDVEPQETWTHGEAQEFEQYAAERLKTVAISAAWAGAALLTNVLCVWPFLYGWPLHRYWDSAGKYLLITALALLLWFTYKAGLVWASWQASRDTRREFGELQ